jgi:hypothetical protein
MEHQRPPAAAAGDGQTLAATSRTGIVRSGIAERGTAMIEVRIFLPFQIFLCNEAAPRLGARQYDNSKTAWDCLIYRRPNKHVVTAMLVCDLPHSSSL